MGFPHSPRFLGIDPEGREILTYLEGDAGPASWPKIIADPGLTAFAHLLRTYHDAVADFPATTLTWHTGPTPSPPTSPCETPSDRPPTPISHGDLAPRNTACQGPTPTINHGNPAPSNTARQGPTPTINHGNPAPRNTVGQGPTICHGDFGPWNTVWQDPTPTGILDWDYAHPAPALHDIAYALEYAVPFRPDEDCVRWLHYPTPPNRRHRLELFATAYGLTTTTPLIDAVITTQHATLTHVHRLATEGREPQTTWLANGHLTTLHSRLHWTTSNRSLFE
ncbi:aminoglycoside phosphotransferase family protein [Actinokineospora sp. NPDC004072]